MRKKELYSRYMKKFNDRYRIGHEYNEYFVRSKIGRIFPYDINKKLLVAVLDFDTQKQLTYFKKRIEEYKDMIVLKSQEGECDISLVFEEEYLDNLKELFELYKKRQYTEEERDVLRKMFNENVKGEKKL